MKRVPVLAGAALAMFLVGCAPRQPSPEPVRPVQLAQVGAGGAPGASVLAGEVKPRFETDLGFRIAGKIVERRVDVGARVHRGQVLAQLDPIDMGLQVQAAQAAVDAAETDLRFARSEYRRYQDLHAQKFISASALDGKRSALDTAQSRAEQARAQFAVTRNQAGYATLTAPDDGVITAIGVEAGQVVSVGQAVMKLARESEREVAISVPENRLGELRAARALVVALWASPSRLYAARVREISPAVDPVTRTFAVRVSILDPDAALRWGMTANVGIITDAQRDAALLPLSSIYHASDGAAAVWIYDPQTHKVQLRDVKLVAYREDGVLVDGGVRPGEWVVAAGVNKLEAGQLVRPYEGTGVASPGGASLQARS
jgi:RND family efflux transporter MFP subunit